MIFPSMVVIAQRRLLLFVVLASFGMSLMASNCKKIDRYKVSFTEFPKNVPTVKTVDAPVTGNGDIGLTMAPSKGHVVFYVGKNDFWKSVESYPEGIIALPGGLTLSSELFQEKGYYAEQLPGSAELRATFKNDTNTLVIKAWVPALDNKVVIELESTNQLKLSIDLWTLEGAGAKTSHGTEQGCSWIHRGFENLDYLLWPSYVAMAMNHPNGDLFIEPGKKCYLVLSIYTNHDTMHWHEKAIEDVITVTEKTIDNIYKAHFGWWNSFWDLSEVWFDDDFLEKYYYQSQYLFACSSRKNKFAPGIWGPFITSDKSAWAGDYHLNYNYESPYWACFSSNHISLTENYDEPILDYMERGRQHARNLLNCRGVLYPVGIGPKGLCTSTWPRDTMKMKAIYGVWNNRMEDGVALWGQKTNASFVVGNMMMHFYSTYDKDYARKIYEYVKSCAEFWEDYLILEKERYVVKGDAFKEHNPWDYYEGDFNNVLSLGMARMVFKSVMELSIFLKKDKSQRSRWRKYFDNISSFPVGINAKGRLSLKYCENNNIEPKGISRIQMYGLLIPSGMTGPILTPELNKIMLNDLMGWSSTDNQDWGTSIGNGIETVYPGAVRVGYPAKELLKHLKKRIKMGSYPNYYIFAEGGGIETLSAVPNTINEMMMQSYEGIIRVFPNWDREIDAKFRDLRAYGAFLISSSMENGQIISVSLKSEQGRPCKIKNPWPTHSVKLMRNGKMWKTFNTDVFDFKTRKGDIFEISLL